MAVSQANNLLEDGSQIESGPLSWREGTRGTFVGVYDGHGGPETSRYITEHLFANLKSKPFSFVFFICNHVESHLSYASHPLV